MNKPLTKTATLSAVAALSLGLGVGLGPVAATASDDRERSRLSGKEVRKASNLEVIGLAGDRTLVRFDTGRAHRAKTIGQVTGLAPEDTRLVGIDYRVQDGKLYGVGRGGGVYTLDPDTQQATLVLKLTVALAGTSFGVDFNPAANALRVISDTGQNLRQPFATAGAPTAVDGSLTSPPTTGVTTGVTGAAYTNNDLLASTATTLFDLATNTNQVVIQSPANSGQLVATGTTTMDLVGDTGFDIYSTLRNNAATAQTAYAVNAGRLYGVSLLNGQFTDLGQIGSTPVVTDLAIPLDQQ